MLQKVWSGCVSAMVTEFGKLAVATTAICIQPKQFGARLNTCIKTRCEQAWQNMPRIGSGPAPGTISMARKESSRLTAVRYGSNFLGCFQRNRGEYEQFTPATQPVRPIHASWQHTLCHELMHCTGSTHFVRSGEGGVHLSCESWMCCCIWGQESDCDVEY